MEVPTVRASKSVQFPANFIGKIRTHFLRNHSSVPCWLRNNHIEGPVSGTSVESSGLSVSTICAENRDRDITIDFVDRKGWVHFVGVGGCGLSALAMLALKQGFEVSGSDIVWSSYLDRLKEAGACLHIGHSTSNIRRQGGSRLPDAIVLSSAIPEDNIEVLHAKSIGVPVYKRDSWLGKLTRGYNLIAISGSHGKSTTAAMLAYVLKAKGDDLTAVVGANVPQFLEGNIVTGNGQNFVLEADEYDCCFLGLSPYIAVVTNMDWEHVDIFENEDVLRTTFKRFLKLIRPGGHLILCGDRNGHHSVGAYTLLDSMKESAASDHSISTSPGSDLSGDSFRVTTYGISSSNEWHASSIQPNSQGGSDYKLCHRGCPVADISLRIPGVHNVLNSLAVIASVIVLAGNQRNIYESIYRVRLSLCNFEGISRRFEMIGSHYGCHVFDDYAHHPTEVRVTLQAARQRFPSKALFVVFQPHKYSRLAALKDDFAKAFSDADHVLVTAVYAAGETNVWNVSGRDLASSIIGPPSEYISTLEAVVEKLVFQVSRDPSREIVVLTLGAGDVTMVGRKLLHELQQKL